MSSSSSSTLPVTVAPGMTSCMRLSERRNVDLPQPDGPMSAVTVLGSIVSDTSCTATFAPYEAVRFSTSNRLAMRPTPYLVSALRRESNRAATYTTITTAISVNAPAQARSIAVWYADSAWSNTKRDIALCGPWNGSVLMYGLLKTVTIKGAVSPMTRATASITPVMMPADAVGRTIRKTVFHLGMPSAYDASRSAEGTSSNISSLDRTMIGSMSTESASAPANPEKPRCRPSTQKL